MKKAVCLISGGMDSFVSAAIAKSRGYRIYGLTVNYGQKNKKEISSAVKIAGFLKVERHIILEMGLSWVKSALTDRKIRIPRKVVRGRIPATYVPARNTIFLSLALALAESVDAAAIFIGVNSVDFSGYPDCSPVYIKKFQKLINVATKKTCAGGKIELQAPLLYLSKGEIIKKGLSLGLDFFLTWSCYGSGKKPCRECPSCIIRTAGFASAKIQDPLFK